MFNAVEPGGVAMENWEDILAGYLEGIESRADAESLRWKIHLAAEVREEVEAVLRLADEVAAAIGSVAVPEGAVSRLQEALHGQGDWHSRPAPANWRLGPGGFEATQVLAAPLPAAGLEDAINALIEGTAAGAGSARDVTGADEELSGRLEQVRSLTSHLSELASRRPPEGAVDRMLSRFREDVSAGAETIPAADAADEEVARQFLARLRPAARRPQLPARPDVLAASADDVPDHDSEVTDAAEPGNGAEPRGESDSPEDQPRN
jgi:hypothetical protein